jgi:hypothetical protein
VLLDLALVIAIQNQWVAYPDMPYSYLVGMALVAMLTGEFRDFSQRQIDVLKQSNLYRQVRLDEFTRSYHLLKVSHDRLEQQLAGHGQSLREALRYLQRQMSQASEPQLSPRMGRLVLDALSQYTFLQRAALLNFVDGKLEPEPVAELGGLRNVNTDDPLILESLTTRQLVSIPVNRDFKTDIFNTDYLLVVPLVDSEDHVHSLVVVQRMPFFALTQHTLTLLAVMAGRVADFINLARYAVADPSEEHLIFGVNLMRAVRDAEQHQVPACLVVMDIATDADGQTLMNIIYQLQRGLDLIVTLEPAQHQRLLILLPLTDELGLAGYRQRLEEEIRSRLGASLMELPVKWSQHRMTSLPQLKSFLKELNINEW